jgi:amino acid transporter
VRMIYGMARNGQLPASRFLTRLSPRTDEPIGSIAVAVVLSLIPLIFIKRVDVLVAAITGMIIIPYILVLGSLLVRRLQGWPKSESKFNLRRWGMPVTVIALAWTIFVLIDAAWPRAATNPNLGSLPVIEYLGLGVLVVGVVWWFVSLRAKARPDHAPAGAVPIESE